MAYCDVCGNFDSSHNDESAFNQEWKDARKEFDESYQPDLYYYWDAPLEEIYYWRDSFPNVDCMCEIVSTLPTKKKKSSGQTISVTVKTLAQQLFHSVQKWTIV